LRARFTIIQSGITRRASDTWGYAALADVLTLLSCGFLGTVNGVLDGDIKLRSMTSLRSAERQRPMPFIR
jgi:hypothetical protein